ncbi:SDR family oxidoreductase [Nocardia sp. NBC_01730]|uniref:SDR family oxidoreductase n=1 Tax=Nocardia sp. NBC_01730 TaxID=2975998 RepID=UPI002E13FF1D|nr:SDR family oxidoreductase [Nocardia sp. NBC_01730]
MDQARDIGRKVTVDATELAYTRAKGPFLCIGCKASMVPVAVGSTKVMPHFRVQPNHEPTCNVAGRPVPIAQADSKEDAQSERLGGVAIAYKLIRPTIHEEVDPDSDTEPQQRSTRSTSGSSDSEASTGYRETAASTIRPFCPCFHRSQAAAAVNWGRVRCPGAAVYASSKAALELLTKSWGAELGPHGVRVNAIAPGPILTEGTAAYYSTEQLQALAVRAPARRVADVTEIAATIGLPVSDHASFIHGAILPADGGRTAV